jgi:hypothetical protein
MGTVTYPAAVGLQDFMGRFLLIVLFQVALGAGGSTFMLEQVACLGRVGIMATGAFSRPDGRVDLPLGQAHFLLAVAGIAEIIARFLQEQRGDLAMPKMTVLAFFLLDDRVDGLHAEILTGELRMAVQTFFSLKFPLGKCRVHRRQKDDAGQEHKQSDEKRPLVQ